jgi:hypothetical protein
MTVAGLQTGLHDGHAARLRDSNPAALGGSTLVTHRIGPIPGGVAAGNPPTGQRMVGEDRNVDGQRDVEKKALVLSPYAYDFGDTDSGPTVSTALGGVADYAGRVEVHAVTSVPTGLFPLTHYTNWNDYEVIHLSTHGDTNLLLLASSNATCMAIAPTIASQLPDPLDRLGIGCFAVNAGGSNGVPNWTEGNVTASPAFFVWHYPGGLERKVIYLDACRTTFASGIVDALLGQDSIIIGWDEYVDSQLAKTTAAKLYQDAAGLGYPMWRSVVRQCAAGACLAGASIPLATGQTKPEELEIAYDRADLRIREGLTVTSDFTTGFCVEIPDVPLEASCPTCVDPNPPTGVFVVYDILVEGVVPEDMVVRQDPGEFALEQLRLFADADGEGSGFAWPIWDLSASSTGDGQWESSGVPLAVAGVCPGDVVEYQPKVMLPAYDLSMGGVRDFMYSINGPYPLEFGLP